MPSTLKIPGGFEIPVQSWVAVPLSVLAVAGTDKRLSILENKLGLPDRSSVK